ncbi:hypothetical protein IJ00_02435 [Calothrix sp. 336/3]|nr:hypothetical protein IJ00_02435 [Calothrix sp. 336/3]
MISHELRTPLNAILGMTEGLKEEVFGALNERQTQALSTIESSGEHLLGLIENILDVSRIETGKITLELASVNMEEICTDILAIISPEAAKKNIQLITDIQPNLTSANLDRRRITQSIIHLMSNAVKFTNNGGKVKLKITSILKSSEIPWLVIYVIDNGIGISAKDINTLFQPFVQLDSGLNRQYEGTGLGLVLVKKIVEQHGGKVKVKSEVGKGSCFMIELPYAK